MNTANLIKKMQFAKKIHIEWAEYQKYMNDNGFTQIKHVGDAKWHLKWSRVYDEVIKKLKQK